MFSNCEIVLMLSCFVLGCFARSIVEIVMEFFSFRSKTEEYKQKNNIPKEVEMFYCKACNGYYCREYGCECPHEYLM